MKSLRNSVLFALAVALSPDGQPLLAANAAPRPPNAPAASATAPGGRKGGGRGGPLTAEDQAALAKLADLPLWKPGADVGDYSLAPPYPRAPAPVRRAHVP